MEIDRNFRTALLKVAQKRFLSRHILTHMQYLPTPLLSKFGTLFTGRSGWLCSAFCGAGCGVGMGFGLGRHRGQDPAGLRPHSRRI